VACDVLRGTTYRCGLSTGVLAACALLVAVGFGVMKETTDLLAVKATGARHDSFDAIAHSCANIVGAGAAVRSGAPAEQDQMVQAGIRRA